MLRKVLIGFAVVLFLLMGASAYVYHRFVAPSIRAAEAQVAANQKMLQPRLIVGAGNFEKHVFYTGNGLGDISQILVGWPADRESADITVVGDRGADFVDSAGEVKKQVRFSIEEHCPIQVVRLDWNGDYGYLTRDESWAVPVALFDKDGRVRWHYGGWWSGVDDSAAADLSGKRTLSVIVGLNGSGGVVLLNERGKQV